MRDEAADVMVSTDRRLLDVDVVFEYFSKRSYWSKGIPRDLVERSLEHSVCFGLYRGTPDREQVGFARVVTDHATFAWLCDVFVLDEYRGRGLGKLLVQAAVSHPDLAGVRRFLLATRDAHGLYGPFGFRRLDDYDRFMFRAGPPYG